MSVRTVQNVVTYPGSAPMAGRRISIRLNVPGFHDSGATEILSTRVTEADNTGLWSVDLTPNSEIDPAGTYYTVQEVTGVIWSFIVPAGSGTVNLHDCLVNAPPNTSPVVAGSLIFVDNGDGTLSISTGNSGVTITDNSDGTLTLAVAE